MRKRNLFSIFPSYRVKALIPEERSNTVGNDKSVLSDAEIVSLYYERNETALGHTRRQYGNLYRHVAFSILENSEDADECLNDTLLRMWNSIPPAKPFNLSAYGAKIARNLALDRIEKEQAQKRSGKAVLLSELDDALPDSGTDEASDADLAEAIDAFLRSLSRDERILFVRRYFYGQSCSELSDHFASSESKIKSGLFRLRKKLKKHLEKEGISL